MKYERFEDLPVWKTALDLALRVYTLTRGRFFSQPGDLRDQIRRAALSVSNNIAEGFERGSTAELLAFLYIARGSAGEVRSMLRFVDRSIPRVADGSTPRVADGSTPRVADGSTPRVADGSTPRVADGPTPRVADGPTPRVADGSTPRVADGPTPRVADGPTPRVADGSTPRVADQPPGADDLKSEISDLISLAESCSRQIRAWADNLQNSDIKGQRHLDDRTRKHYENRKNAEAFERELAKTLHKAHPDIYPDPDAKK